MKYLTKLVGILAMVAAVANIIEPLPYLVVCAVCGGFAGVTFHWIWE